MRTMVVVFTKSKKTFPIFSWLIMLWTWKNFSHVALKVELPHIEKPMLFQASEGSVNYEYWDHFDKKHEIVEEVSIDIPDEIYSDLSKKRLMAAGEEYGFLQNVGIVLVDICKVVGLNIDNPWKRGKNCSEIIYETVLKPMNPELDFDPNTVKPHHIKRILDNLSKS